MQKILIAATALAIMLPATAYAESAPQHRVEAPFKVACTKTGCQRISASCQEKHGPVGIVPRGFDTITCKDAARRHISARRSLATPPHNLDRT